MSMLNKLTRIHTLSNVVGMSILFLLVLLVTLDVFLRYVVGRSIVGSTEISGLLLAIAVALTIGYTQEQKGHIRMDFVVNLLGLSGQLAMTAISHAISVALFGVLIWQTASHVGRLIDVHAETMVLGLPLSLAAWLVPYGFTLIIVLLTRDLAVTLAECLKHHLRAWQWILIIAIPILLFALPILPSVFDLKVSPPIIGLTGIVVMLLLFAAGMPIAFALMTVGFLGMLAIKGVNPALGTAAATPFRVMSDDSWIILPFFVMMGVIAYHAGQSRDLFTAANKWIGNIPGGVGVATIGSSALFSAVVGESIVATTTFGAVAYPELKRLKYKTELSAGLICAGGTLGPMIPPSIVSVVYALLTDQSIAALLIAAIVPGIIVTIAFVAYIYVAVRINPSLAMRGPATGLREKFESLRSVLPILTLILLVVGGIYVGIFTPTEAGAIGTFGALIIGLAMRRLSRGGFIDSLLESGTMTAFIFLILVGGDMLGTFFTVSEIPMRLATLITNLNIPRYGIGLLIVLVYVVLGAIFPAIPLMLVTIPIFFPVAQALGYDPIWFGTVITMLISLATMTPPFGVALFALKAVAPEIPLHVIFKGSVPFIVVWLITIVLVYMFEPLATWLPSLMRVMP